MLKDIALFSVTGYAFKCGDDVIRTLFPRILVLSGDYEEQ